MGTITSLFLLFSLLTLAYVFDVDIACDKRCIDECIALNSTLRTECCEECASQLDSIIEPPNGEQIIYEKLPKDENGSIDVERLERKCLLGPTQAGETMDNEFKRCVNARVNYRKWMELPIEKREQIIAQNKRP